MGKIIGKIPKKANQNEVKSFLRSHVLKKLN